MGSKRLMKFRLTSEQRRLMIGVAAAEFVKNPGLGERDALEKGIRSLPEDKRPATLGEAKAKWKSWLMQSFEYEVNLVKAAEEAKRKSVVTVGPEQKFTLEHATTDELIIEVVRRVALPFEQMLAEALKKKIILTTELPPEPAALPPPPKKLKVLIIGLLPGQEQMIRREFGNEFNLKFTKNSANVSKYVGDVDRIYGLTAFMTHSQECHVKDHKGYTRVSGGMTAIRDELTNLFVSLGS